MQQPRTALQERPWAVRAPGWSSALLPSPWAPRGSLWALPGLRWSPVPAPVQSSRAPPARDSPRPPAQGTYQPEPVLAPRPGCPQERLRGFPAELPAQQGNLLLPALRRPLRAELPPPARSALQQVQGVPQSAAQRAPAQRYGQALVQTAARPSAPREQPLWAAPAAVQWPEPVPRVAPAGVPRALPPRSA